MTFKELLAEIIKETEPEVVFIDREKMEKDTVKKIKIIEKDGTENLVPFSKLLDTFGQKKGCFSSVFHSHAIKTKKKPKHLRMTLRI